MTIPWQETAEHTVVHHRSRYVVESSEFDTIDEVYKIVLRVPSEESDDETVIVLNVPQDAAEFFAVGTVLLSDMALEKEDPDRV